MGASAKITEGNKSCKIKIPQKPHTNCITLELFCFRVETLQIFSVFPLPSELIQENVSCGLCASVPPMFSSSSLMVSGLTFRSLTHFGFIFVYGVRRCSGFIVFHGAVQLSQRQGPGSRGGAGRACVCVRVRVYWGGACVLPVSVGSRGR